MKRPPPLWLRRNPDRWLGYRWAARCLLARLSTTAGRVNHLIEASDRYRNAGAREQSLHCGQRLNATYPHLEVGWIRTAEDLMALRRFHEANAIVASGLERFPQCRALLDLRSRSTTLLPFEQVCLGDLIHRRPVDSQILQRYGKPSTALVPEETEGLYLTVAHEALLTDAYGAFDRDGTPLDGCFFYRAGLFLHGPPQRIDPPPAEDCEEIPVAIYLNNIELGHFGHRLTDGCASIYPLLLWARQRPLRDAIPIVTNRQLADRVPELVDLLELDPSQVLIPSINVGNLRVHQLLTPVPSMLNGGSIPNGGYVNRQHPAVVKELISRSLPAGSLRHAGAGPGAKLYLSRSRLSSEQRRFLDETALEQELSRRGWTIFHPQEHPLQIQMQALAEASSICSTQGSALHLLFGIEPDPRLRVIMLCGNAVNVNYLNQCCVQAIDLRPITCLTSAGDAKEHWLRDLTLRPGWTPTRLAQTIDAAAEGRGTTERA